MESTQLLIKYNSLLGVFFNVTYYCLFILIGLLGYTMLTYKNPKHKLTRPVVILTAILGSSAFLAAMVVSVLLMKEIGRIY